ncbi:phosphatidate cytidylyltransferase [Curtobacterium sp. Leaf261]|uniref:phosphatidate cytidylyltransferase n=1 Tax=Curtobacterium sp. Leaf261 TaxID=1736311 RepID=UPI0009EA5506|nr:phosphatidate cytidylyltransferase [Curtobacterium sp. Leaf261]
MDQPEGDRPGQGDGATSEQSARTAPGAGPRTARERRADFDARARAARTDFETQLRQRRAEMEARNQRLTARTGRNLPAAIGIALAFAAVMLGSQLAYKPSFMVVAAFLIGVGVYELASAMRFGGRDVPRIPSVIAGVAIVPAAYFGGPEAALVVLLGGVVLIAAWRAVEFLGTTPRLTVASLGQDVAAGLFVQLYVTLLGVCTVLLTALPDGNLWVIGFVVVVVAVDTGAYATGLNFGKHPMAPRISPKKTWEGFAGSVTAALIAGVLISWLMLGQAWWFGLVLGVLITLSATLGDLTESLIKRDLGIKDISTFLPGHGGMLDRIDSVLPSAAVAYVLYLVVH